MRQRVVGIASLVKGAASPIASILWPRDERREIKNSWVLNHRLDLSTLCETVSSATKPVYAASSRMLKPRRGKTLELQAENVWSRPQLHTLVGAAQLLAVVAAPHFGLSELLHLREATQAVR